MAQYIPKSALLAEIERVDKSIGCDRFLSEFEKGCNQGKEEVCDTLRYFLDTLEAKEVDIEDAVHGTVDFPLPGYDFPNIYPNYKELKDYCDKNDIKDKDKVKLIIIKEE